MAKMGQTAVVSLLLCTLGVALAARETELAQQALGKVEKAVEQAAKDVKVNSSGLPADVIADVVQKVTQAEVEKILQSSDFYSAIAKHIVGLGGASSSSSSTSSDAGVKVVGALKADRKEYEGHLNKRIKQVKDSEQELEDKLKELQHEADLLHEMHAQLKRLTQEKSRIKGLFAHMAHRFHVHPHHWTHHWVHHVSAPMQYITVPAPYAPVQPPQGSWQWVPSMPQPQTSYVMPTMLNSQPMPAQPQQLQQQQLIEPVEEQQTAPWHEPPIEESIPTQLAQRIESPDGLVKPMPAERLNEENPEALRSGIDSRE
jgi:hypothetical protein